MKKKEKKHIAPNECSFDRWIAVILVGMLIRNVLYASLLLFMKNQTGTFMGVTYEQILDLLNAALIFVGLAISLKLVGKTSVKNFILGVDGKVNKQECLIILSLYVTGFSLSYLPVLSNIRLRGVNRDEFGFLVMFMLMVTWMQTTWEEFIFRGIVIRWVCKNDVHYTKMALIAAVVSSLAFALMHVTNPEVTTQSGIRVAIGIMNYAFPGMMMFVANLHFGSLLPGILMHWINNFIMFTVITSEVSAMPVPTLLVDTTPHNVEWIMISEVVTNLPLVVYMILDARKKKEAVASC